MQVVLLRLRQKDPHERCCISSIFSGFEFDQPGESEIKTAKSLQRIAVLNEDKIIKFMIHVTFKVLPLFYGCKV